MNYRAVKADKTKEVSVTNRCQVAGCLIAASGKSVTRKHMPHSKVCSTCSINAGICLNKY